MSKEAMKLALEALKVVTKELLAIRDEIAERGARSKTNILHQRLWDSSYKAYTDHALPAAVALKKALGEQPAQQELVGYEDYDRRSYYAPGATIEMAREAGFNKNELAYLGDNFTRFAELVRDDERGSWPDKMEAMESQVDNLTYALAKAKADEREACAKVCDDLHPGLATRRAAEIIRARSAA